MFSGGGGNCPLPPPQPPEGTTLSYLPVPTLLSIKAILSEAVKYLGVYDEFNILNMFEDHIIFHD